MLQPDQQLQFGLLERCARWSRRHPAAVATLVALTVLIAASHLLFPILVARVLDALTRLDLRDQLSPVLWALCGIGLARGVVSLTRSWLLRRIRFGVTVQGDDRLVGHLLHLAPEAAQTVAPGDAARAVNAGERACGFLFGEFAAAVAEAMIAPALIVVLAVFDWRMALVGLALAAANAALLLHFVRTEERLAKARAQAQSRYAGVVEADLAVMDAIRLSGLDNAIETRWQDALRLELDAVSRANRAGEAAAAMQSATSSIGGSIAFAVGGALLIVEEAFGVGHLMACLALLFALNDPARRLIAIHAEALRTGARFARRTALEALDTERRNAVRVAAHLGFGAASRIELEARDLVPPSGYPPLSPLTFASADRRVIGLAGGPPGAALGLCRALVGFDPPASGEVLVNQQPALEAASGWAALVEGPAYLVPGSIRENITLFDPDPSPDRLREAIALARLDAVIAARPQGLGTRIGRGHAAFSRGELYRLEIARALYHRPAVLVLAGAAESLDPPLARALLDGFATQRLLCLVATTSPPLLKGCDAVIALES